MNTPVFMWSKISCLHKKLDFCISYENGKKLSLLLIFLISHFYPSASAAASAPFSPVKMCGQVVALFVLKGSQEIPTTKHMYVRIICRSVAKISARIFCNNNIPIVF